MSYVEHQMKEKIRFQKYFLPFYTEISLQFEMYSIFIRSKQQEVETNLIKILNRIPFHWCPTNENFVLFFDIAYSYLLRMMFYQK